MQKSIPILYLLPAVVACAAPDFRQLMHSGQTALSAADIPGAEKFFLQACGKTGAVEQAQGRFIPDEQATCEHHLAIVDEARGDYTQAESRLLKALPEWQLAGPKFVPAYTMSLMNLGEVYRELHRYDDAEVYLLRAIDAARQIRSAYPQIYPETLSRLGGAYAEAGRLAQARPLLAEALAILHGAEPGQQAEEARVLDTLGGIDLAEGQNALAQARYNEAIRLFIAAKGIDHPETADCQLNLALAFLQNGQLDRAEPLLNRARYVIESQPIHNNLRLGTILAGLSVVARAHDKTELAEAYGLRALEILDAVPGRYPSAALMARINLSAVWIAQGRPAEAEKILPGAVDAERRAAPGTCLLADGLRTLAALRAQQRAWPASADLYREAIGIYETRLGPNNPMIAPVLREYADVLKRSGASKDEAKKAEARARAIRGFAPPA